MCDGKLKLSAAAAGENENERARVCVCMSRRWCVCVLGVYVWPDYQSNSHSGCEKNHILSPRFGGKLIFPCARNRRRC
jgi:hypothetical protein